MMIDWDKIKQRFLDPAMGTLSSAAFAGFFLDVLPHVKVPETLAHPILGTLLLTDVYRTFRAIEDAYNNRRNCEIINKALLETGIFMAVSPVIILGKFSTIKEVHEHGPAIFTVLMLIRVIENMRLAYVAWQKHQEGQMLLACRQPIPSRSSDEPLDSSVDVNAVNSDCLKYIAYQKSAYFSINTRIVANFSVNFPDKTLNDLLTRTLKAHQQSMIYHLWLVLVFFVLAMAMILLLDKMSAATLLNAIVGYANEILLIANTLITAVKCQMFPMIDVIAIDIGAIDTAPEVESNSGKSTFSTESESSFMSTMTWTWPCCIWSRKLENDNTAALNNVIEHSYHGLDTDNIDAQTSTCCCIS